MSQDEMETHLTTAYVKFEAAQFIFNRQDQPKMPQLTEKEVEAVRLAVVLTLNELQHTGDPA